MEYLRPTENIIVFIIEKETLNEYNIKPEYFTESTNIVGALADCAIDICASSLNLNSGISTYIEVANEDEEHLFVICGLNDPGNHAHVIGNISIAMFKKEIISDVKT